MKTEERNHQQLDVCFSVKNELTNKQHEVHFTHSNHSLHRSSQRGVNNDKLSLVLEFGDCMFKQGLNYFIIGSKNRYKGLSDRDFEKVKNTVVVVAGDSSCIITCYKSDNPFRNIKKKTKKYIADYGMAA